MKNSSTDPNNNLRLTITGLSHDGRGLGFPDSNGEKGKAVFVAGSLPGQVVACRIKSDKKNFAEAELVEILKDLPDRQPPLCPHVEQCGGCPLQAMPYELQLKWKGKLATDAMRRIGGLCVEDTGSTPSPLKSPDIRAYRNKAEFAFGGPPLVLGFRQRQSHAVFPVHNCALVDEEAIRIVRMCESLARKTALPAYIPGKKGFWRFLILRKGIPEGEVLPRWHAVCITSPGSSRERNIMRTFGERLMASSPALAAFIHEERFRNDAAASGEKRIFSLNGHGGHEIIMRMGLREKMFLLDPASFFQVNNKSADILAGIAMGMARDGGHTLLDLYCGVGAPGLLLAHAFSRIAGVESDKRAAAFAHKNAQTFGIKKASFIGCDAGAFLEKNGSKYKNATTVLIDPPRAGMDKRTLAALVATEPRQIIYISCNPATLARDSAVLANSHELLSFNCVDLFPHTPHVECCTLWQIR